MSTDVIQKTSNSRVFLTTNRAGPANKPEFRGSSAAQGFTWPQGDLTPIRVPSDSRYGEFVIKDIIQGQRGLPQLPVIFRSGAGASDIFEKVKRACPLDLELHFGVCANPSDFATGWHDGHILVVEAAHFTDYSTDILGALDADQNAPADETAVFTGLDAYQITALQTSEVAGTEVTDPIIAIVICDHVNCGSCGEPSDGCERVFALTSGVAGSPGLPLEIIFSNDKGLTWSETSVGSAGVGDVGVEMICVGTNMMVITDQDEHHWANLDDIILGTEVWAVVTTGYVAAGSPIAAFSLSASKTWICGDGGYIYFSEDITTSVTPQTAGDVTTEDLADIHGNADVLVAVGANNAVLVSESEGAAWTLITGPAVGIALTAVEVLTDLIWLVGDTTGNLWYTQNGGVSWTQKAFPGDGDGEDVMAIEFVNRKVGYMAQGQRILRSIDGGYSWVVSPEDTNHIFPTNTVLNAIGICTGNPNLYFAGGADGADGVIVKAAAIGL